MIVNLQLLPRFVQVDRIRELMLLLCPSCVDWFCLPMHVPTHARTLVYIAYIAI